MAEFKKKNKVDFWRSPIMLFILFVVLVVFFVKMVDLVKKERNTHKKKILMMEQIDNLNKREEILLQDIEKLNSEEGIEEIIREKYQVAKEGEKMVVIVEGEKKDDNEEITQKHGFWNWVKNIFK